MRSAWALLFTVSLAASGCSCSDDGTNPDAGPAGGGDGSTAGMDGSTSGMDGSVTPGDGSTAGADDGGTITLADGRVVPSGPAECQGHLYECGDTLDNDSDTYTDWIDPDCLGPCDNNEEGFHLNIPGGDAQPCRLDCYFDQDEGFGNDTCQWDHRCDPLEPDPTPLCRYQPPERRTGDVTCPDEQQPTCAEICRPLVPNGCDCFGCCNLPAGGDRWVFIGSVDSSGTPTCTLDQVENDEACHPCTPVDNCLNTCGECELCLGRSELPEHCFPPPDPVDAGTLPDGAPAPQPDSGTTDGGTIDVCEDDRQDCGVPGLPPCPDGYYCVTGCCTFFG